MMPEMNGIQTLHQLKLRLKKVKNKQAQEIEKHEEEQGKTAPPKKMVELMPLRLSLKYFFAHPLMNKQKLIWLFKEEETTILSNLSTIKFFFKKLKGSWVKALGTVFISSLQNSW